MNDREEWRERVRDIRATSEMMMMMMMMMILKPKYFLLVDFRSYFFRMFYSMFLADWLKNIKM